MPKINNDVATIQKWLNNGGDLSKLLKNYESLSDEEKSIKQIIEKIKNLDNNKVEKDGDKSLSTNDFTDDLLEKLKGIESGATKTIVDNELKKLSSNPVANSAVKKALDNKVEKEDDKGLSTNDYSNEEKIKLNELNYYADFETTSEHRFTRDSHFKVNEVDGEEVESVNLVTYVDGSPVIKDRKFKDSRARDMAQNANSVAASAREMIGKVEGTANQALEIANSAINFTQELEQNVAFLDMRVSEMGNDIQANIKPKLTDLDKDIADLEDRKANVFSMSAKGENINIKDSADSKLNSLKIYGKSKQTQYSGKNLIPFPYETKDTEKNGVKFTINSDGTIVVNGTATEKVIYVLKQNIPLNKGTTYTLSGCPSGGSSKTYAMYIQDMNYNPGKLDSGKGRNFTAEYDKYYIWINIESGTTINNLTFKPQLEKGLTVTEYEPYTGGKPSPSPEYPQEIINSNEINLNVVNKNLLPYPYRSTTKELYGVTCIDNGDGSVTLNGKYTHTTYGDFYLVQNLNIPAGTYTLSGCPSGGGVETYRIILTITQPDGTPLYRSDVGNGYTFNADEGTTISASIRIGAGLGTVSNLTFKPMLELSPTVTEYLLHNKQTLTIPDVCNGVPVSANGNYVDTNGQQWLCDEYNFTTGKKTEWIRTFENIPSFAYQTYNPTNAEDGYYVYMVNSSTIIDYTTGALCNYFTFVENGNESATSGECFSVDRYNIYFKTTIPTLAEFQSWLDAHNVIIQLIEIPEEKDISTELMNAYSELKTYKPVTNIYTLEGAGIEVDYDTDLQSYIDAKFAELQQAIISMGGNI